MKIKSHFKGRSMILGEEICKELDMSKQALNRYRKKYGRKLGGINVFTYEEFCMIAGEYNGRRK